MSLDCPMRFVVAMSLPSHGVAFWFSTPNRYKTWVIRQPIAKRQRSILLRDYAAQLRELVLYKALDISIVVYNCNSGPNGYLRPVDDLYSKLTAAIASDAGSSTC